MYSWWLIDVIQKVNLINEKKRAENAQQRHKLHAERDHQFLP